VLTWRLETRYHERLTEVHDHLRDLNAHVDALKDRYDAFVRTRQAAAHSYLGFEGQIDGLRERVRSSLTRLEGLRERQGRMLEAVASRELRQRREQLAAYQNKARFAFADSYDRAAKNQAR
jgi:chromosome segregation ATPase